MSQQTALIFGATGAVGKQLLKDLLQNGKYEKVVSFGRRNVQFEESVPQDKLFQKIVDFENLEAHREDFRNASDVYCCFGTTYGTAGGAANFTRIDHTYVVNSAKLIAEENKPEGAKLSPVHFLYCSSNGANKKSWLFYTRSKGKTEYELEETGFEKVSIFRPGILEIVEERPEKRFAESVVIPFYLALDRVFKFGLSVNVATVGKVMSKVGQDTSVQAKEHKTSTIGSLVSIYNHWEIKDIGGEKKK